MLVKPDTTDDANDLRGGVAYVNNVLNKVKRVE